MLKQLLKVTLTSQKILYLEERLLLYVGTGGDLSVRMAGNASDATVVIKNVADGSFLPIVVKAVLAATTASDILAIN